MRTFKLLTLTILSVLLMVGTAAAGSSWQDSVKADISVSGSEGTDLSTEAPKEEKAGDVDWKQRVVPQEIQKGY